MKGSRVQAVVQELRGEKIDIVPFDRDPARYVIAAIQPAEVQKVIVDEPGGRMEIVVPDEKLSLAIGRKGQNVRLASQLTDWKLDVISESKFRKMEEEAIRVLGQIGFVDDNVAKAMYRLGFRALEEVAEAGTDELAAIPGVGDAENARKLRDQAAESMEQRRSGLLRELAVRDEPPTERERLMCVRGLGARTLVLLEDGGYKSLGAILKENEDRLGIRTGLGFKKASAIKKAAEEYALTETELFTKARAQAAEEIGKALPAPSEATDGSADDNAESSIEAAESSDPTPTGNVGDETDKPEAAANAEAAPTADEANEKSAEGGKE